MAHNSGRRRKVCVVLGIVISAMSCSAAFAWKAVDDTGTRAHGLGPKGVNGNGWPRMVAQAHAKTPNLAIYWPHPDRSKGGVDYVGDLRPETDYDDQGPRADNYRCANGITDYNIGYNSNAYAKDPEHTAAYHVIIENSTPRACDFFFDRGTFDGYQAGIFTHAGDTTIHLTKVVGHRSVRYTASAALYQDTGGTGSGADLKDCALTMKLGGTTVSINVNHSSLGGKSWAQNCSLAEQFASRMHRLRYVKR